MVLFPRSRPTASPLRPEAEAAAARLPALLIAAEKVATTVAQGAHGRRRVGQGDAFWQFRPYSSGDPSSRIDWRQSARRDGTRTASAYVRDPEWEAAQSVLLWRDTSASMAWRSAPDLPYKRDRAGVLLLALTLLLSRGGERIGLLGSPEKPSPGRLGIDRIIRQMERGDPDDQVQPGLPPRETLPRRAQLVLIGDFLGPVEDTQTMIAGFLQQECTGHLVQVLDPAEEDLPYAGRIRFEGLEREAATLVSRTEDIRERYRDRVEAHRAALAPDHPERRLGLYQPSQRSSDDDNPARPVGGVVGTGLIAVLSFLPFAFTTPWVLAGLAALPGLWWLLRATPPAPAVVRFPAIRLLYGLTPTAETAAHTPWWLLLLRLGLAALLILGFSGPVWHPGAALSGTGSVVLVVDDGWAAARDWSTRQAVMRDLVTRAGRADRKIVIVATAPLAARESETLAASAELPAAAALGVIDRLQPHPWAVDRGAAARRLAAVKRAGTAAGFWLADGVDSPGSGELASALDRLGSRDVMAPPPEQAPIVLAPAPDTKGDLTVDILRMAGTGPRTLSLRVTSANGVVLTLVPVRFEPGQTRSRTRLPMPIESRNRAARIDIDGERSAGSVVLLDAGSRVPTIGVVAPYENGAAQPLLSPRYYITRALAPYGDLRRGTLGDLLQRPLSLLVLNDDIALSAAEAKSLGAWVEGGGVLLRFSGPGLATAAPDPLLPVVLRQGGRSIGGAMSWETPARLAPFAATSPFAGLAVPQDVTVSRQVLAEPAPDLAAKTWARLTDGTPLVTAAPRGRGSMVLFHTTANAEWSNLALSGLFVEMLRRVADLGVRQGGTPQGSLAPYRALDGFGALTPPPPSAAPIDGAQFARTIPGPDHPPGYYGTAAQATALNLGRALVDLAPLPGPVEAGGFALSPEVALQAPLLGAAALLFLFDIVIGYGIRGLLRMAMIPLLAAALAGTAAQAASDENRLLDATGTIHLAYVMTGDADADATAREGLAGLSWQLAHRTAVTPGDPMAVDLESDDLIVFPVIYWAVTDSQAPPSPAAVARINQYLATGGVLLMDTRDQEIGGVGGDPRLGRLLAGVHVPPLEPIRPDHVLTRSFYLMRDFPGRWSGGTLWVEPPDEHVNDGVSALIVGANDWAAAWATDANQMPLFPVEPGGEHQRELAYRFGINLVMYALTGNYKADQLHVGAILERLGR